MFYPSQTSFIPVTVSITRFIESFGFEGFFPYWYLGTTPVKYLIGPVVPGILIGLHKILPNFSFFDLSYILLFISYVLNAFGWGIFARGISGKRLVGWWVAILCLLLPWRFFSTMAFGEVSAILANAMTPWVLVVAAKMPVLSQSKNARIFAVLFFALLLLTNSTAAIPAIVGIFILAIITSKKWEEGVKAAGLVIFVGWLLTVFWYGFGYWVSMFFKTPSIGGKSVAGTLVSLLNSLRAFLPVMLAIVVVRFGIKPKNLYEKFVFSWLGVFVCITLFRFVADVDFWMDWTSWVGEIEVGMVMLTGYFVSRGPVSSFPPASALSSQKSIGNKVDNVELRAVGSPSRTATPGSKFTILLTLFSIYFLAGWFLVWHNRDFWMPRKSIENTAEYKIAKELERIVEPGEIVFLSGSSAFWLNSLSDVFQVRGGRDEVSQNSKWREVNWQLTEGVKIDDAVASLKAMGVDFIVVHSNSSFEYYHDFKNPEVFGYLNALEEMYDESGDRIYKINMCDFCD